MHLVFLLLSVPLWTCLVFHFLSPTQRGVAVMGSDLISGTLFFLCMWLLCTVLAALPWYSCNCWIGVKSQFHPPSEFSDFLKPIYCTSHPFTLHTRLLFRYLLSPHSYFLFYFICFHAFFSHFLKIGPTSSYCLLIIAGSSLECTVALTFVWERSVSNSNP